MSNVDIFRQYASELNLSPAQLEAVTNCFKACFEADEGEPKTDNSGVEHAATETPDSTTPSEQRQPHKPFEENFNSFPEHEIKKFDLKNIENEKLRNYYANAAKNASVAKVDPKVEKQIMDDGKSVAGGNYENVVLNAEKRQSNDLSNRIMRWQTFLNKTLGLNLDVDGKWGKQTAAAYQQYLDSKKTA